jgi:isoquinoline 1-oxidoreductase alpha subunit
MPAMTINVNGKDQSVDASPDMPLLWVLRDILGLTGTKFGCGLGLCGACTVHLNGSAVRSCRTSIKSAAGKKVVTIEGLSGNAEHPVQQCWRQLNVPQCGYCQSGQIMQAAALLKQKPKPTDDDIDSAMRGNICRCGTYQRIRQAIKLASTQKAAPAGTNGADGRRR